MYWWFFWRFNFNRFFPPNFYICLSNLDLSESLDLYYYVPLVLAWLYKLFFFFFFFSACFLFFGSLCIYCFSLFLLFLPSLLPPVVFVLVFCSCLHYFRYFFPPLDSPRAGSRWSSCTQLLPPPAPLVEHSCDADTANLQYPHPRRGYLSRPLNPLPENEGV